MLRSAARRALLRQLVAGMLAAAVLAACGFPAVAAAAGNGPQNFPNARIADVGLRYVGQSRPTGWDQPGECIKWVQAWVREAGGRMNGGGPVTAYTSSPAMEVSAQDATRGDVFQISIDDTYSGSPHTGVLLGGRNGDGTFDVVEGNVPAGSGRVRTSRRSLAPPARHQLRFWRFGTLAPTGNAPKGTVDAAAGGPPGFVLVRGWSYDPDTPTTSTQVHVYVDGPAGQGRGFVLEANQSRPDVAAAFPGVGSAHGYAGALGSVAPGNHSVYVYAINTTANQENPLLWSGTVNVPATAPGTPLGSFDTADGRVGHAARVRGWTFDPDAPGESASIHAYIDGWAGSGARGINLGPADAARPDVDAVHHSGDHHGFDKLIDGLDPGLHTVWIYAINRAGAGDNPLLRVLTVNVPGPDPIGSVDVATGGTPGFVQLVGWTMDPDTPRDVTDVHVYIGGPAGSGARGEPVRADISRPDIPVAFPGASQQHGFSAAIGGVAPGPQPVYVYAINTAPNQSNPLLWSGTIDVPGPVAGSPTGSFDVATGGLGGRARVKGWTVDPDAKTSATDVHAYIDGPAGSGARGINLGTAAVDRPDVAAAVPGAGRLHGFDKTVDGLTAGTHVIWVYAINRAGGGQNPLLGAKTVSVPPGGLPPAAQGPSTTAGVTPAAVPAAGTLSGSVRARVRRLRWIGRTLALRLTCPADSPSPCVVRLALRAPASTRRRARTVGRLTLALAPGAGRTVRMRARSGAGSRRKLRLRVRTDTTRGRAIVERSLRKVR